MQPPQSPPTPMPDRCGPGCATRCGTNADYTSCAGVPAGGADGVGVRNKRFAVASTSSSKPLKLGPSARWPRSG